jgi:hypothetical protein
MDPFLKYYRDGRVEVISERFHRKERLMGGNFIVAHWDLQTKQWAGRAYLRWKYRMGDPSWITLPMNERRYGPIIDPWIRHRLILNA